jgi:hypothetical protein
MTYSRTPYSTIILLASVGLLRALVLMLLSTYISLSLCSVCPSIPSTGMSLSRLLAQSYYLPEVWLDSLTPPNKAWAGGANNTWCCPQEAQQGLDQLCTSVSHIHLISASLHEGLPVRTQSWVHIQHTKIMENSIIDVRFEVFTAVTMKNGVFWDVTPCGSCKIRRFGET